MYLSMLQLLSSFSPLLASSLVSYNCTVPLPTSTDWIAVLSARNVQKDSHVLFDKLCWDMLLLPLTQKQAANLTDL